MCTDSRPSWQRWIRSLMLVLCLTTAASERVSCVKKLVKKTKRKTETNPCFHVESLYASTWIMSLERKEDSLRADYNTASQISQIEYSIKIWRHGFRMICSTRENKINLGIKFYWFLKCSQERPCVFCSFFSLVQYLIFTTVQTRLKTNMTHMLL